MNERQYYIYMLTNQANRVLYTGVTNDLVRRLFEHRTGVTPGFAHKYRCHKLVWFEATPSVDAAIAREKQIKGGSRARKVQLIEAQNPQWRDLAQDWMAGEP